ncbi:helix-turn-helix domain-containing protein [Actinocrispum wychmicini]|uniref:Transcriptional regulator with XRE-family HTH domain n=1 Tax=Actinocrispum wychmicini TaxID=1213861 RepID=A0A4V2S4G2_9PSEU|nr:helix-turn-helix transcriptional regulator [Actinocrispum wychmicini]TCO48160.1 transcriptional regulator with XRE-family HTH domain [Actinocrispum wychmicini]
MDHQDMGRQLRALRTTAGRTVASVASDAGLSVPYVANLENGRGNPTTTALDRLAKALGTELTITFATSNAPQPDAPVPPSLVRLSRTQRFRRDMRLLADTLDDEDVPARVITALTQVAAVMGRDLSEPDWWRLLDALLLVGNHPTS